MTLPGLTARYIDYIHDVQRVLGAKYGSPKLIICIDELDKITDPEQVGAVLREIKGAIYEKHCFYLLSISEDAVRAFEGRLVEQRDIFESTFDEIIFIERLDLETCLKIARRRAQEAGYDPENEGENPVIEEAFEIAAVLSTGVPRELLRNLRAVENQALDVAAFEPSKAWHTLFERKLLDILKKVRTADGLDVVRADLLEEIELYLTQGRQQYNGDAVHHDLSKVRERRESLLQRAAALQGEAQKTDRDERAAALSSEVELVRAWIRHWTELEIHLLVRQCNLVFAESDSTPRSKAYAQLLKAYAGLPYSIEATVRRVSEFRFAKA